MYRWHKDALSFLSRHRQALLQLPVAVFALGPVHDPHDAQEWQDSRAQLDKELAKSPWFKPVAVEMFGGRFDSSASTIPAQQACRLRTGERHKGLGGDPRLGGKPPHDACGLRIGQPPNTLLMLTPAGGRKRHGHMPARLS